MLRSVKQGEAYVFSPEKRRLDVLIASMLVPLEVGVMTASSPYRAPGLPSVITQRRAGAAGQPFEIYKLRTLGADGATPISPLHAWFRQNGLDELPQIRNILRGDMSIVGRRPLLIEEYEEQYDAVGVDREGAKLVDLHRNTAGRARPGLLSTHAIRGHQGDDSVMNLRSRLELDVADFFQASQAHTMLLARIAFQSMIHGELEHGSIKIEEPGIA